MEGKLDEFTVTLVSNANGDIFNNTSSSFVNVLSKELHFPRSENWRVCLSSILFSNSIENYEKEELYRYMKDEEKRIKNVLKIIEKKRHLPLTQKKADIRKVELGLEDIYGRKSNNFYKSNPLFVQCDQIKPKFGDSKILSSFFIPPYDFDYGSNQVILHEPNSEEYFDLASSQVKQIGIKIINPYNEVRSYVSASHTTIVVLKFKKMTQESLYTINLTNNENDDPTDFIVNFPESLVKDGTQNPWEIAVSRISFIPLFMTIPDNDYIIGFSRRGGSLRNPLTKENWDEFFEKYENNYVRALVHFSKWETYESFLAKISDRFNILFTQLNYEGKFTFENKKAKLTLEQLTRRGKKKPNYVDPNSSGNYDTSSESEITDNSILNTTSNSSDAELTNNSISGMSEGMSDADEEDEGEITDNSLNKRRKKRAANYAKRQVMYITMNLELFYVLGFDGEGAVIHNGYAAIPIPVRRLKRSVVRAKRNIDLNFLQPKSLLLYTNCVLPSLVGAAYGNYLTHVPLPQSVDISRMDIPYTVYEPKNLDFHPLKTGSVKNIQMKLLQTDGRKPKFAIDDIKIFVTLVLRLRPLKQLLPSKQVSKKIFNTK